MNKSTNLDTLVSSLSKLVTNLGQPAQVTGGKRKRKTRNKSRKAAKLSRNPGTRNPITRVDNQLSLTRAQFTATSPLNYFSVNKGTTPGGIRVQGRELIGSVTASATLTGQFSIATIAGFTLSLPFNPIAFPRLSAYVPIYEMYKFHKADLLFQANQPTTATGEIFLAVDYDAKDTVPTTSTGFMRNVTSTMANIYSDCSCQLLGSLSRLPKYNTSEGGAVDVDQVNQAQVLMAFEGVTAAISTGLGYLIVQYDVEFFTPQ